MRPSEASRPREAIFLLAVAAAGAGISLRCVEPMLPKLAADFGSSVSAAAGVITAFAFAYTASVLLLGPMGDRFGKLRVATVSVALTGAACLVCALAWDVASLAGLRFLMGVFASAPVALGLAYIGDAFAPAERQGTIARFIAGSLAGQAAGPLFGGLFTDSLGWRAAFVALGVLFLAIAAVLYARTARAWSPAAAGRFAPLVAYRAVLRRPAVRWLVAIVVAETFFFFGAYVFLGVHFKERYDLAYTLLGLILAGYGIGGILYSASVDWVLRMLGDARRVAVGGVLGTLLFGLVLLAPHWAWTLPCTIGLGISFYLVHNTLQMRATEVAPDARGTAVALFAASWALGQALGVAAMGAAARWVAYVPLIVVFAVGWGAFGLWLRGNLGRLRAPA